MSTSGLDRLASFLQGRGLSTTPNPESTGLTVANPISSALTEDVSFRSGGYVTGWGYEIGQAGHEAAAADRLAFLLGVPPNTTPRPGRGEARVTKQAPTGWGRPMTTDQPGSISIN